MPDHGTASHYRQGCRCDDCKAAQRAVYRKWYEANREKKTEASRQYRKANGARTRPWTPDHGTNSRYRQGCRCDDCREARREYNRVCRIKLLADLPVAHGTETAYTYGCRCDECKAAQREKRRKYRAANPEKCRETSRQYNEANRDKLTEKARRWREANPDRDRANSANSAASRRSRKRAAFVDNIDRQTVFDRDGWICHICGEAVNPTLRFPDPMSVSLDHIIPIVKGGEHSYANTATSHLGCNNRKRAKMPA